MRQHPERDIKRVLYFLNKLKMKNEQKRMMAAEVAVIAFMVEVAIIGTVPEFNQIAIFLSVPFFIYGLYYVLYLNK